MKPLAISTRALALALLVVAAGDCGGGRGLAGTADGGSGGTAGMGNAGVGGTAGRLDAGADGGASDVARDASQDTSGVVTDTGADVRDVAVDAASNSSDVPADGGALDAGDGRGDGSVSGNEILCPLPTQALITDFTYVPGDGGTTTAVPFGNGKGFSGTEYVYPTELTVWPLTSDVTGNNWHITGNVGTYSGFGLTFDGCNLLDASAYRGISFTISGSVLQGSSIMMGVATANDTIAAAWLNTHGDPGTINPGRCIPAPFATNRYSQNDCFDPTVRIPITATPTTLNILWSDFSTGKPEAAVSPADILSVYWTLPSPVGVGTTSPITYPVDVVIDNLAFVP